MVSLLSQGKGDLRRTSGEHRKHHLDLESTACNIGPEINFIIVLMISLTAMYWEGIEIEACCEEVKLHDCSYSGRSLPFLCRHDCVCCHATPVLAGPVY